MLKRMVKSYAIISMTVTDLKIFYSKTLISNVAKHAATVMLLFTVIKTVAPILN